MGGGEGEVKMEEGMGLAWKYNKQGGRRGGEREQISALSPNLTVIPCSYLVFICIKYCSLL